MPHHYGYEVVRRSTAAPGTLFGIVSDGSAWSTWARPLIPYSCWESLGPNGDGGVGAIRAVGTRRRPHLEMTTIHEPGRRHGYTILTTGKAIRDYRAEVSFIPDGTGTLLRWTGGFGAQSRSVGRAYRILVVAIIRTLSKKLVAEAQRRETATSG